MSVKAFVLVPALEKLQLMGDKARTTIECIESCGKNMYIGTNDCFVVQYQVEEKHQQNGKVSFSCAKMVHKYLGYKKPISEIKAIVSLNCLLVNCDGNLIFLSMFDLEPMGGTIRMRGISSFCLNENSGSENPFCVQVCIARRKQLQIFNLTEEKAIHVKDVGVPDVPLAMAMDGVHVCAAFPTNYSVINCETCCVQELFPYDSMYTKPLVKRINKEEFLVSGPNALGMFVTTAGTSERPPLQWSERLKSTEFCHPYILAMDQNIISVYSVLDQQMKQNLQFAGGHFLHGNNGHLLAVSMTSVYVIVPVPWEKQVEALLADRRVQEALQLAQNVNHNDLTSDQFYKVYRRIQQEAGFIEFSEFHFYEAKELFHSSRLDVRELISLFPGLLPSQSTFTRAMPPLHDMADIVQMTANDPAKLIKCKRFLIDFLEEVINGRNSTSCRQEVETALLKLYSEVDSPELTTLIVASEHCVVSECAEWLALHGRHHALALFYHFHGSDDSALDIWINILTQEYQDQTFPGLHFVVEFLANLQNQELVWKYVDVVLGIDQVQGVRVFIDKPAGDTPVGDMDPHSIVEYLHRYPVALQLFLEHTVFKLQLQKEALHTHLAMLYMDQVVKLVKDSTATQEQTQLARQRLQRLIRFSSLYRVQILLGKAQDNHLHMECAILHGKLGEHEKALHIIVHELEDYPAAEEYCRTVSEGQPDLHRHGIYFTLLSVYLDPQLQSNRREELLEPAVQLLNNELSEFDAVQVMKMIPEDWGVEVIYQFLNRSLRSSLTNRLTRVIEHQLSRGENLQAKFTRYQQRRNPIFINEIRLCEVCNRPFATPEFTRFPNGIITHSACATALQHTNRTTEGAPSGSYCNSQENG